VKTRATTVDNHWRSMNKG